MAFKEPQKYFSLSREPCLPAQFRQRGTVWREDGICGLDLHLCSPPWKGPSVWGRGSNTRKGNLSLPKLLWIATALCLHLRKRWQKSKRQKLMLQTCRQILRFPCIFHFAKEFGIGVPYSTMKTTSNFWKLFHTQCYQKTHCPKLQMYTCYIYVVCIYW